MRKCFIVAGHRFSIIMDDASPFWEVLQANYGPFEASGSEQAGGPGLFTLQVALNTDWHPADTSDMKCLFSGNEDSDEVQTFLYRSSDSYYLELAVNGRCPRVSGLRISADFKTASLEVVDRRWVRFAIDNSAMLLYSFNTAGLMTLEMHSSVTVNAGKAYMFLAESGTGKSTHSRMWLENIEGSELLNDDNPVVRVSDDGLVTVYGTPWSGKTPCYRNASAPLGAMVQIRRSATNVATPLSVLESYALLMSSSSGFRGIEALADGLHDTISAISLAQPFFVLDCRPDAEAAFVCHKAVCG